MLAFLLTTSLHAQTYDLILIGAGTAGSIVATKLTENHPNIQIALIDAGGPLSRTVGGNISPPYFEGIQNAPTYCDIPGEWRFISQKKWRDKYIVPETAIFFQGKGYGGLSEFNALICQIPPSHDFNNWPEGWNWEEVSKYFTKLLETINVTTTPSADGKRYGKAFDTIIANLARKNSIPEGDTLALEKNGKAFYGPPSVYVSRGERKSSSGAFLAQIIDSKGKSKLKNLHLLPHCTVEQLVLDGNRATKVTYHDAEGKKHEAKLNNNGRVILAAGSLNTPRLLLLSGIGPEGKEKKIFGADTKRAFSINNPLVGYYIHDHYYFMTASLKYNKELQREMTKEEAIDLYVNERSGPYAKSGHVMLLFGSSDGKQLDFEVLMKHTENDIIKPSILPLYPTERKFLEINAKGNLQRLGVSIPGGEKDVTTLALSYQNLLKWISNDPDILVESEIPSSIEEVKQLIALSKYTSHGNHFGGGCPLAEKGGTNPKTLLVEGTTNIHVVDGSLIPSPLGAHPVLTIMALALKAAEIIDRQISAD